MPLLPFIIRLFQLVRVEVGVQFCLVNGKRRSNALLLGQRLKHPQHAPHEAHQVLGNGRKRQPTCFQLIQVEELADQAPPLRIALHQLSVLADAWLLRLGQNVLGRPEQQRPLVKTY
ncbi:hypothetical protein [uncultured Hymenobacter sp.]|uniref:hypothetical protein n=1 Tax=uncultured Hymenobacter sp. TaxID=170016 RepID=UPI0035CB0A20